MTSFSGSWMRGAYVDPAAPVRHTADPAHQVPDELDPSPTWHGPSVDVGPSALLTDLLPGMEWVVTTPGRVIDRSATRAHDADPGDHGASRDRAYGEPPERFADEIYDGARFESFTVTPISTTALQRGLNGLPTNNPDGFRNGWVEQSWISRKFAIGERVHDHRVLLPNTAFVETTGDGSTNPPASPYLSPFAPLARVIKRINQTPEIRRQPPDMLAGQVTDGSPLISPPADIWVVG